MNQYCSDGISNLVSREIDDLLINPTTLKLYNVGIISHVLWRVYIDRTIPYGLP